MFLSTGVTVPGDGNGDADETASPLGTDTDDELANACITEAVPGYFGYVHQCEGLYQGSLEENNALQGQWPNDATGFFGGAFDSYANPEVMACCDIYDPGPPPPPQPHLVSCYYNFALNFCNSLESHIQADFAGTTGINDLAAYVGSQAGQNACLAAFVDQITLLDLLDPPLDISEQLEVSWLMPEYGIMVDPTMTATVLVWDVYVPASSNEWIECSSYQHSMGVSLLEVDDSADFALVLEDAANSVEGPIYDEKPMEGSLTFTSNDNSCVDPLCSRLHFSQGSSDWLVHNLSLFSGASTTVIDGDISVTADWYNIEMAAKAAAATLSTDKFQIGAHDATFALSGAIEGGAHRLTVSNSSAITIEKIQGVWTTSAFTLTYHDTASDDWTLSIGSAEWVAPQ